MPKSCPPAKSERDHGCTCPTGVAQRNICFYDRRSWDWGSCILVYAPLRSACAVVCSPCNRYPPCDCHGRNAESDALDSHREDLVQVSCGDIGGSRQRDLTSVPGETCTSFGSLSPTERIGCISSLTEAHYYSSWTSSTLETDHR